MFSRDIAAAYQSGLFFFSGLQTPQLLDAVIVDPPRGETSDSPWKLGWSQVRNAARHAKLLILDNPELLLAAHGPGWLEGLIAALEALDCTGVLNLRPATPPNWAKELTAGPLFAAVAPPTRDAPAHSTAL